MTKDDQYPPPPPAYAQPAQGATPPPVKVFAPTPTNLGKKSQVLQCSQCQHRGPSKVDSNNCTAVNWILTLFCGLCCFFCVPATAKHTHMCSKCGGFLGGNNIF